MLFWLFSLFPRWGKQSGFMVLKKINERWRWTCGKWWIKWRGRNHSMGRQVSRLICRVWHRGIRDIQVSGYMWYHGSISWTTSRYVLSSDYHIPCGKMEVLTVFSMVSIPQSTTDKLRESLLLSKIPHPQSLSVSYKLYGIKAFCTVS